MKNIFNFLLLLICTKAFAQKPNFFIEGKIESANKISYIMLIMPPVITNSGFKNAAHETVATNIQTTIVTTSQIKVKEDGSFKESMYLEGGQFAGIFVDGCYNGGGNIWIEPGNYVIDIKQQPNKNDGACFFTVNLINVPVAAKIYAGLSVWPNGMDAQIAGSPLRFSGKYPNDSIDSLLEIYPDATIWDKIIRDNAAVLGYSKAEEYFSLTDKTKTVAERKAALQNYLARKRKLQRDRYFADFEMNDLQGKPFKLSAVKAKLILLNFWSSDCEPCRANNKGYAILYERYHTKGLEIVNVSLDKKEKKWQAAIKEDGLACINVSDLNGFDGSLAKQYFITAFPCTIWMDGDRKIFLYGLTEIQVEEILNK